MKGDWQPIETAPKDGTPILGYDPGRTGEGYFDSVYVVRWMENSWQHGWIEAGGEGYDTYHPTHWMPRPNPPTS